MKLIRFGDPGNEKPGLLDGNRQRRDLSALFHDWNGKFFIDHGIDKLISLSGAIDEFPVVPGETRWASCVARPGKVICVGLNYSDHAAESGMAVPEEPIIFSKRVKHGCRTL